MLLRFTQEATLLGYMKDAEGHAKDTKIAAQDEKGDAPRPKSTLRKPQLLVQKCTIGYNLPTRDCIQPNDGTALSTLPAPPLPIVFPRWSEKSYKQRFGVLPVGEAGRS